MKKVQLQEQNEGKRTFFKTSKNSKNQHIIIFSNLLPKTLHTAVNFEVDEKKIKKIEEKGEGSKMYEMISRTKFETINFTPG